MTPLEATYRLAALASSTSFAALVELLLIESGHADTARIYAKAVEDLRLAETAANYAEQLSEAQKHMEGAP